MNSLATSLVSVVIPVFNDSQRLALCLRALDEQTYPRDRYEIIVADNSSTDDIGTICQAFPHVVITHESQPGSYAARNKGIDVARGNILAFTDSDCIPSPDWLENGVKHLVATPNCGIAAGRVEFFFQQPERPNAVELYDSLEMLQQEEYVKQKWGATANLFTTSEVFKKVGLFNAELKSGGDLEWGRRVAAYGFLISYVPDSVVAHPARASLQEMRKKMLRRLGGGYALRRLNQEQLGEGLFKSSNRLLVKLRPPIRSAIRKSFLNSRVKFNHHRIVLFGMVFVLHYLEFFELLRLRMGGTPSRQ